MFDTGRRFGGSFSVKYEPCIGKNSDYGWREEGGARLPGW